MRKLARDRFQYSEPSSKFHGLAGARLLKSGGCYQPCQRHRFANAGWHHVA
jgi:hypothetical protein